MAKKITSATKLVIPCRISFANIFEPKSINGSEAKYSVSICIHDFIHQLIIIFFAGGHGCYIAGQCNGGIVVITLSNGSHNRIFCRNR